MEKHFLKVLTFEDFHFQRFPGSPYKKMPKNNKKAFSEEQFCRQKCVIDEGGQRRWAESIQLPYSNNQLLQYDEGGEGFQRAQRVRFMWKGWRSR